jgi:hypothetical protein
MNQEDAENTANHMIKLALFANESIPVAAPRK